MSYPLSLSRLVGAVVGAKLGKGLTFSHWDQRPLSNLQLRYAADDVRYLPVVHAQLVDRLERTGRVDWARQESAALCDQRLYVFDPDTQCRKVRGAGSLTPQQLAVLRELLIWRDGAARAHNVPPRSLARDEVLVDMSRSPVKSVEKLDRVKGLPRPVEAAHGAQIVEATLRALALPKDRLPDMRSVEESPNHRFRADALWAVVQCLCAGRGIDPALVSSRQDTAEFFKLITSSATGAPGAPDELAAHRLMQGWRRAAVGEALLSMVLDRAQITLDWNERSLRTQVGLGADRTATPRA
jgi:ribonuclease D